MNRLNDGLERELVILSAPAGFGKSTLVSQWLETLDYPSAWLTLDASDNDLPMFLGDMTAAIQTLFPSSAWTRVRF